jgi:hypothetical protein
MEMGGEEQHVSIGLQPISQALGEDPGDVPKAVGIGGGPGRGVLEGPNHSMGRNEGDRGQADALLAAGRLELEDAVSGRQSDHIDEVDPARLEDAAQELEEMGRVVVAGQNDNRRDLCQDTQRVAGQLEIVDCWPRPVEEIAGVDRQVRRELTCDFNRLLENVGEVFASFGMTICAAKMPVRDVQEPH